jgi:hypothetical protein
MKAGNLNFLEPLSHSRPVTGLPYLYLYFFLYCALFVNNYTTVVGMVLVSGDKLNERFEVHTASFINLQSSRI